MTDEPRHPRPPRDPDTRRRDHDQIDRLADDILPDLIARLAASGLGEIEVREDDWRVRLRRPAPARSTALDRADRGDRTDRTADRPARTSQATHNPSEGRPLRDGRDDRSMQPSGADGNGTGPGQDLGSGRVSATSPAVGVFQPRPEVRPGSRVRAGDRLATVDLLGVPQDVLAPEDGVIVDTLVEAGEGVEYGQELLLIEPAGRGRPGGALTSAGPLTES